MPRSSKSTKTNSKKSGVFSDEERAAMKERIKEEKAAASKAEGENAVLSKINEMPEPDRKIAKRLHTVIKAAAPILSAKTWYGMPAYANETGDIVCFFQPADKFKTRYATLGFSDEAKLDEGAMWPAAYALMSLGEAEETKVTELVRKAVG